MKKLSFLLIAATALTFAACDKAPESGPASLKATPEALTFLAKGNSPQAITVTAENVEWDFTVSETSSAWLKAERNDAGLSVTATDNTETGARSGEIKILPKDNPSVRTVTVLVSQGGTADLYSIKADKTELNFAGEENQPQEIVVTTEGEGLTWTCAMDPVGKTWATTETQDNKIIVTVDDNPKYEARSGKLTITPSVEGIEPVTVTINQSKSTIDPFVRVDKENLDFKWRDEEPQVITVESFGAGWTTSLKDPNNPDEGIGWFGVEANTTEGTITVTARTNMEPTERVGNIIVTPTISTIEPITITVKQEAGKETVLSTLTEDMVFPEDMLNGYARLTIQKDQPEYQKFTDITIVLQDKNLSMNDQGKFSGTGGHIEIVAHSERLEGDEYNYMPSVTYNVDSFEGTDEDGNWIYNYPTVQAGVLYTNPLVRKVFTWYRYYEDGKMTVEAPISAGSMTVSREGDVYTIEFNFEDDIQNKITGTFSRAFDEVVIVDNQQPQ